MITKPPPVSITPFGVPTGNTPLTNNFVAQNATPTSSTTETSARALNTPPIVALQGANGNQGVGGATGATGATTYNTNTHSYSQLLATYENREGAQIDALLGAINSGAA